MYDNVCKFMAEMFSEDFSDWLLGKSVNLTELKPSELSIEPIRADSLIFLQSEELVLHLEFQTNIDADIPFRMADYRLRLYRRFPDKEVYQVVIYLRKSNSELVKQTIFRLRKMTHEFNVVRLWEEPTETFLSLPGLFPFAVLSRTENSASVLQQISELIEEIPNKREQSHVAATTAILAGLVLNKQFIQRVLRREIMRESVIYQDIRAEEAANVVFRLLKRKIGEVSQELQVKIQDLSVESLEDLAEALLDFQSESELKVWLEINKN